MEKASIYHINGHLSGGAAIAAKRLFNSLRDYDDLNVRFYSWDFSNEPGYYQYNLASKGSLVKRIKNRIPFLESEKYKIYKEFNKYLDGRPEGLEMFSLSFLNYETPPPVPLPDIFHLHWIGPFLDYSTFFEQIPKDIPIVWTLHDMHPFTGGCHYSNDCIKYQTVCEKCPQLGSYSRHDLANYNISQKERALAGRKIHVVADSEWLKATAQSSHLFKNAESIRCIHYGLDHRLFAPTDKLACRKALGVDAGDADFFICFGANDVTTRRKGMNELIKALEYLRAKDIRITCLVFGFGKFQSNSNIQYIEFGNVTSEVMLSQIYNAADLFIMPSLEEAFGQTCLEAMSCGVPVVAFDTGGIPDMVKDQETGLLVKKGDARDLAEKILFLLGKPEIREKMSLNGRMKVEHSFTLNIQAAKYYDLYKKILN